MFADISHHQTEVDLAAYAAAGYQLVILKATQGTDYIDPTFTARWRQADALGLARGAYHFAGTASGAAEFDHFFQVLQLAGLRDRDLLCLDSEDTSVLDSADERARDFTTRAAALGRPDGWLYTGRWYADPANLRPDDLASGWRQLWISDYTTTPDGQIPLPAGWTRTQVAARQFTSSATIAGITGPCDANRLLKEPTTMDDMAAAIRSELERINRLKPGEVFDLRYGDSDGSNRDVYATLARLLQQHTNTLSKLVSDLAALDQAIDGLTNDVARVAADVIALKAAGGTIDPAALAAELAGPLAQHLAITISPK